MGRSQMQRPSPLALARNRMWTSRPVRRSAVGPAPGCARSGTVLGVIGEHERVTFFAGTRWLAGLAVGLLCVAAVVVFGELSTGALLAVGGTGVLVAVVGLVRRAGEAALSRAGCDGGSHPTEG